MQKILNIIFFILFLTFILPSNVYAEERTPVWCDAATAGYVKSADFPKNHPHNQDLDIKVTFDRRANMDWEYRILVTSSRRVGSSDRRSDPQRIADPNNPVINFHVSKEPGGFDHIENQYDVKLFHPRGFGLGDQEVCNLGTVYMYHGNVAKATCSFSMPNVVQRGTTINVEIKETNPSTSNFSFYIFPANKNLPAGVERREGLLAADATETDALFQQHNMHAPTTISIPSNNLTATQYKAALRATIGGGR